MTNGEKLRAIRNLLKRTRTALNKACDRDCEYDTSTGNGVNSSEASAFFKEIEEEMAKILDDGL